MDGRKKESHEGGRGYLVDTVGIPDVVLFVIRPYALRVLRVTWSKLRETRDSKRVTPSRSSNAHVDKNNATGSERLVETSRILDSLECSALAVVGLFLTRRYATTKPPRF